MEEQKGEGGGEWSEVGGVEWGRRRVAKEAGSEPSSNTNHREEDDEDGGEQHKQEQTSNHKRRVDGNPCQLSLT